MGDFQDRLLSSVWVFENVGHVFPTEVHMRHQVHQFSISQESDFRRRALPVWVVRRDSEALWIGRRSRQKRHIPARRRLIDNRKPHLDVIGYGLPVRRVMKTECNVGSSWDELCGIN